jgi:hypothetical protein
MFVTGGVVNAAEDDISRLNDMLENQHYLSTPRDATQLCRKIALDLQTASTPTTPPFETMNTGRPTQRE